MLLARLARWHASTRAARAIGSTASTAMALERIVIVGAGPAGLATARAYREHGGAGAVTLIGEEPLAALRRPPLTKEFLRGELDARRAADRATRSGSPRTT